MLRNPPRSICNPQSAINNLQFSVRNQQLPIYNPQLLFTAVPSSKAFPSPIAPPSRSGSRFKREQLGQHAIRILRWLADFHEACGEYELARNYARRQVELEPWLEEAHRQLMRITALTGQRSAALAQYETCKRLLAD